MKRITGYLLGAAVLALLGVVCLAGERVDREMARAQQNLATLNYDEPEATFETAERYFEYGSRLPWIGNGPLNDVRARKAALYYWQRQYGAIVPQQTDPVGAIAPDNVELQLVVANAVYRTGQAQAKDRRTTLQALDAGINAYFAVLKNAKRHEDAAYNYEYLVRLRADIDKGRRKPELARADPNGPLGRPGMVPQESSTGNFKIYIPLDSQELKAGQAGKALPKGRKG
jgi:hypothetical protein